MTAAAAGRVRATSAATSISGLLVPRAAAAGSPRAAGRLHELQQMADDVLEDRRVQLVIDLLALPLGDHEPRVTEHPEVARNGRPARMESVGDLPRGPRPRAQQVQDVAAWLVAGTFMISNLANYRISRQQVRHRHAGLVPRGPAGPRAPFTWQEAVAAAASFPAERPARPRSSASRA